MTMSSDIGWIGIEGPAPDPVLHGEKAVLLAIAAQAGLAVPPAFVLPAHFSGDISPLLEQLESVTDSRLGDQAKPLLLSVRPTAATSAGGMAPAILNIGVTQTTLPALSEQYGGRVAYDLYRRLIHSYGTGALGIEGEEFEYALHDALRLAGLNSETDMEVAHLSDLATTCLSLIEAEGQGIFPQDAMAQLTGALQALPNAWGGRRAQNRKLALGLSADLPLSLIVQTMALGLGPGLSGAGFAHLRDEGTGERCLTGRYLSQAQGEDALMGLRTPTVLTQAERLTLGLHEQSLEEKLPNAIPDLTEIGAALERLVGDAVSLDFTMNSGRLYILEVKRARRSARAALQIAVDLAQSNVISRDEALLRVDPRHLEEQLHPSIDPDAQRELAGQGLPASPGAASGALVFSPDAAERLSALGRSAILALMETSPEDIRGMHAASGVLTVRGGMTSHAAVVARGLGKPCIVGARDMLLDKSEGTLRSAGGHVFREGDIVSVDGTTGQILVGKVTMIEPETTVAFQSLMTWADSVRRLDVRANADTSEDAAVAKKYGAQGIGLCRTEHMFFQRGRINSMREMILAETSEDRRKALAKLLPMQRGDFETLFVAMPGLPVTIRLLDPPLHEFLPHNEADLRDMAAALDRPVSKVAERAAELAEFNPMLGKRGCRIGIAYPEIYEMQARAIFEAAIVAGRRTGSPVQPEIMIPLVSAVKELVLLRAAIDAVADAVHAEQGEMVRFSVGVMIETPRACLRAGEISAHAGFLSFGTNDLTQMLYGLSRDDAGRFMPDYVAQSVFEHDPFHSLDVEGVGEIMSIAIERARARAPGISLGLCGEHGADPNSIDFCEKSGLDYISCSPFRLPVARLAAAQASIRGRSGD